MQLEQFVYKNQKKLRVGYTTGTCAAAAAKAAAYGLLTGMCPQSVTVFLPAGTPLRLTVENPVLKQEQVSCAVRKNAGDDPDVTDGVFVYASVSKRTSGVFVDGGTGVGRVTRQGLDQPPGNAAINTIPRRMIQQEVQSVCEELEYTGGLSVIISVPGGEEIAQKTFNPRLGIEGGISILGTRGLVEPMSEQALVDTIRTELRVRKAAGKQTILLTPGNYGETYLTQTLQLPQEAAVTCSNFIGDALDSCIEFGFSGVLFVGHAGKLVKIAAGVMNTHSLYADARMEILTAHAGLCGADASMMKRLMQCVTVDEALQLLQQAHLLQPVMAGITEKIAFYLAARAKGKLKTGALFFTNQFGELGRTAEVNALLKTIQEEQTQ